MHPNSQRSSQLWSCLKRISNKDIAITSRISNRLSEIYIHIIGNIIIFLYKHPFQNAVQKKDNKISTFEKLNFSKGPKCGP